MQIISQIAFLIALSTAGYFAYKSFVRIKRNIFLGKKFSSQVHLPTAIKNMALFAFGQKKMFDRPTPAILHLFIYLGFLIVNLEILEIVLDGLLGTHRLFAPVLGGVYPFLINIFEFFAVAVIISCVAFFIRRNVTKLPRFQSPELDDFPRRDANTILYIEVVLMFAFLNMNAIDQVLQARGASHYFQTGGFFFSGLIQPLYSAASTEGLEIAERFYWWAHILGVFAFANYLPYSKHLHIILAFPNTYYSSETPKGHINNMPVVTNEVKLMLGLPAETSATPEAPGRFGAKDVQDLTWKNVLDAYSCTECGRCTSNCPANITGKKLSPRKIMMDTRDRAEEIGKNLNAGKPAEDGKSLYGDYISQEELLACTTCNACVEACPVNINPLEIIVELRRFMIMEETKAPQSWNAMFSNVENNAAPWKFAASDRLNWVEKLS